VLASLDGGASPIEGPEAALARLQQIVGSPAAQFALFEATTRFLIDLADDGLLVLLFEDLQWADPPSLQLLEHLAQTAQLGHLLIITTCRLPKHVLGMPLAQMLGALVRHPTFDWIELEGLSDPEVGHLISLNGAHANPNQVAEIQSRTGGNPFFVSTFAHLLARQGVPRLSLGALIPNSVRAVVGRGLNSLPEATRSLLLVAAALGRDFDIRRVAAAARINVDDAVDAVHAAALLGVVTEDVNAPGMYRFCHGLVRDTLAGELAGLRRVLLRERAAKIVIGLEDSEADDTDDQQQACG
jgi:predicted ATPase